MPRKKKSKLKKRKPSKRKHGLKKKKKPVSRRLKKSRKSTLRKKESSKPKRKPSKRKPSKRKPQRQPRRKRAGSKRKPVKVRLPRKPLPIRRRKRKPKPIKRKKLTPRKRKKVERQTNVITDLIKEIEFPLRSSKDFDLGSDVAKYKDGSIDGEIVITNIKRGITAVDIILEIAEVMRGVDIPADVWVSIGIRFPMSHDDNDERYSHYRGLNEAFLYWRKSTVTERKRGGGSETRQAMPLILADASSMVRSIKDGGWNKPVMVIIRLHWNPENLNPRKVGR